MKREESYFQNALGNFTYEVASGGAIRHLTDLGYTVQQIYEQLYFPTPLERVSRGVWERLLETEVILPQEPGSAPGMKADYVREYDPYGKASFRKVMKTTEGASVKHWKELKTDCGDMETLRSLFLHKIAQNGEEQSYTACRFGLLMHREPQRFHELLEALDKCSREYVEQLPWEAKWVYHRLNPRMQEILLTLSAKGLWQGDCYFLKTEERLHLISHSE